MKKLAREKTTGELVGKADEIERKKKYPGLSIFPVLVGGQRVEGWSGITSHVKI